MFGGAAVLLDIEVNYVCNKPFMTVFFIDGMRISC